MTSGQALDPTQDNMGKAQEILSNVGPGRRFMDRIRSPGSGVYYERIGDHGLPYVGDQKLMTQGEVESLVSVGVSYCEVFDLADLEQRETYLRVMTLEANGMGSVKFINRVFQEEKEVTWPKVYLEWTEYQRERLSDYDGLLE